MRKVQKAGESVWGEGTYWAFEPESALLTKGTLGSGEEKGSNRRRGKKNETDCSWNRCRRNNLKGAIMKEIIWGGEIVIAGGAPQKARDGSERMWKASFVNPSGEQTILKWGLNLEF